MISPSSWLLALAHRRPLLYLLLLLLLPLPLRLPIGPFVVPHVYLHHLIPRQAFAVIKYILPAVVPLGGMNPRNLNRISVLKIPMPTPPRPRPRHWSRFTTKTATTTTTSTSLSHRFRKRRHFASDHVSTRQALWCGISTS